MIAWKFVNYNSCLAFEIIRLNLLSLNINIVHFFLRSLCFANLIFEHFGLSLNLCGINSRLTELFSLIDYGLCVEVTECTDNCLGWCRLYRFGFCLSVLLLEDFHQGSWCLLSEVLANDSGSLCLSLLWFAIVTLFCLKSDCARHLPIFVCLYERGF